jgi:ABC-type uncharacterized transport system ATPase subunit
MGFIAKEGAPDLDLIARQQGLAVELDWPVEGASVGIQQRVEI